MINTHTITEVATNGQPMVTCNDKPPSRAWGPHPDWRCPWCGAALEADDAPADATS